MKTSNLPLSDLYDSKTVDSNVQYTNRSNAPYILEDDALLDEHHTSNQQYNASNDATYKTAGKKSSVSCGYKSAADIALTNADTPIFNAELPVFKADLNDEVLSFDSQPLTIDVVDNESGEKIHFNDIESKVSERLFMTSLIKHTGIALAIIIPLAAFSAYAATPIIPINSSSASQSVPNTSKVETHPFIYDALATVPTTVDSVDLEKYAGTWYEIGRLPMYFQRNCAGDVTATYTQKTNASGIIVTNNCTADDGEQIIAEGLAKPADNTGSKLKVTFLPSWIRWLPVGRADYWVLARDADYQTALVGTPDNEYLWLLARSPNITQQTYAKYRQIAQNQGYDLKGFKLTPQTGQTVKLIP